MIGKLALLIVFVIGVRGVQILDFKVPSRALLGETVTLDCSWQLEDEEPLYRVTLSHDGREFYRYHLLSHKMVFPVPGLAIDISRSDGGRVVVPNVTTDMAGLYECEVSTGPPRFDVKVRAAAMEIFKPNRGRKPESNNNNEPAQPQVIENEFKTFTTCIQELLDQSVVLKGIKDANANDTVDEVCKKYCDKTPSFKNCFNQLVDSAKGYVGDKERAHLEVVFNVTEQLAQHVCSKSGDSIVFMNKNRVSYQQLMIMGDFFLKHPQLAKGFSQNKEGRNHSRQLWEQLTLLLNSEALGASKSAQNWTAYWNDYKSKLKKKNRLYNNDAHGTGSGPPDKDKEPGEADAKFLAVLGVDFGTGIPGASVNPFPQDDSESVREEINEICGPTMDYNQSHDHQYLKANTTASFTEASTSTSVLECEGEDVHLHDEDHQTDYPIVIEMEEDPLSNQQPRRRSRPMTKFDEAQEVLSTIERDRVAAELTHAQALLAIREELGTLVLCYKKFMDRVADRDTRDHALNERRVGAEEQRVDAEERRAVAEERRVDAEERRAAAEERRAAAEERRAAAEERRADADERRAAAEERRAHAAELRTSNCGCCKNNTNNV